MASTSLLFDGGAAGQPADRKHLKRMDFGIRNIVSEQPADREHLKRRDNATRDRLFHNQHHSNIKLTDLFTASAPKWPEVFFRAKRPLELFAATRKENWIGRLSYSVSSSKIALILAA